MKHVIMTNEDGISRHAIGRDGHPNTMSNADSDHWMARISSLGIPAIDLDPQIPQPGNVVRLRDGDYHVAGDRENGFVELVMPKTGEVILVDEDAFEPDGGPVEVDGVIIWMMHNYRVVPHPGLWWLITA